MQSALGADPTLAQWFWEIPSHEFFASATEN